MEKSYLRKRLVFAVVLLFVGVSVVSGINCDVEKAKNINKIENFNCGAQTLPTTDNTWWNDDWLYRKELGIADASADYQMMLEVWKEDGHDDVMNGMIDCEDHCNDNFSDIRFVDIDHITLLPYWIEVTDTNGNDHYAYIWVNTSGNDIIYMYYGDSEASTTSNGNDTFIFFDDFEKYNVDDDLDSNLWTWSEDEDADVRIASNPSGLGKVVKLTNDPPNDKNGAIIAWFGQPAGINNRTLPEGKCVFDMYVDNYGSDLYIGISGSSSFTSIRQWWNNGIWDWYTGSYYTAFSPNLNEPSDDSWYNFKITWTQPGNDMDMYNSYDDKWGDGGLRGTSTPFKLGITNHHWNIVKYVYVDNFRIQNYTYETEPSWSSFGFEEGGIVLEIGEITGGLFNSDVVIKNIGQRDALNINWSVNLYGGLIIFGVRTTGLIDSIPAGEERAVSTDFIFGLGETVMTVKADVSESSDIKEVEVFILLFFVIIQ